jgi:putative hydrolase of the HAD superfamily
MTSSPSTTTAGNGELLERAGLAVLDATDVGSRFPTTARWRQHGRAVTLQAVIFDLDDTLIVEEAVARASLRSTARHVPGAEPHRVEEVVLAAARAEWRAGPHHGVAAELGIASWEGLWASFDGCHASLDDLAAWTPTYRQQAWHMATVELGLDDPDLASAMAATYVEAQRAGHPLIGGAGETVREAAARYRLGLLTNGPPDIQRLKLDQTGLAGFFDAVVISGETGVGKPSAEAFHLVLDGLGVRPEEAVMVGDSWDRDIEGALAVGIRPVWVASAGPPPEEDLGVAAIPSIGGLGAMLGRTWSAAQGRRFR